MPRRTGIFALRSLLWLGIALIVALLLRFLPRERGTPYLADASYDVIDVLDGDTITIQGGSRVRFVSVDAPEMNYETANPEPFAEAAKQTAEELIASSRRRVRLERCGPDRDHFGRFLKHVFVNGPDGEVMLEEELVRRGLARVRDYGGGCPHLETLRAAEDEARNARRGVWSRHAPQKPVNEERAETTDAGVGGQTLGERFTPPAGFERVPTVPGSFAEWLRSLPLKPGRGVVNLYNGRPKKDQQSHFAVIDIDTGTKDLQQCADAVIRLRAEYLFSVGRLDDIHFNFTSGDTARYLDWRDGLRPVVRGNNVQWVRKAPPDTSRDGFREYLETVFRYAGSASLERELVRVERLEDMQAGDVFIQGGFPGHAVIIVDLAQQKGGLKKVFLLAQSYMPAQDIHVLRNPKTGGPWFDLDFGGTLATPHWKFKPAHLRRFPPLSHED